MPEVREQQCGVVLWTDGRRRRVHSTKRERRLSLGTGFVGVTLTASLSQINANHHST